MKKEFRNIQFLLALALSLTFAFTSCSDDDIVSTPTITDPLDQYAVTGTMASSAEFEGGIGDADFIVAKSQLYYDRLYNKLKFTWTSGDKIGIFSEADDKTQFAFVLDGTIPLTVQETSVSGVFEPFDKEAAYPINVTTKYYSYFPYKAKTLETGNFTYNAIPVTYRNQTQRANEQMNCYYTNTTASQASFLESEKAATAHLAAKDYMVSDVTSTEAAHVHFNYSHMGSIVRFFIQCPAVSNPGLFVDSLQVVNDDKLFTTDAAMALTSKTLEDRALSRVMSLKFDPAVDMTNNYDDTKGSYNYWYDGTYGFIMAYMMIAPTDLSREEVQNSTLYMIAREPKYYANKDEYNTGWGYKEGDSKYLADDAAFNALTQAEKMILYKNVTEYNDAKLTSLTAEQFAKLALTPEKILKDYERKVYKATLSKINFEAGKHYQWVPALNPDEPITFSEISIQEWENGTTFTNEDGTGTEDW